MVARLVFGDSGGAIWFGDGCGKLGVVVSRVKEEMGRTCLGEVGIRKKMRMIMRMMMMKMMMLGWNLLFLFITANPRLQVPFHFFF